jgi:hypothetical protein
VLRLLKTPCVCPQVMTHAPHVPLALSFVLQGARAFDSSAVA